MLVISFIFLIINGLLFREPTIEDIADIDASNANIKIKELTLIDKGNDEVENIINTSIDSKLNTSDNINNISYGKAKFISFELVENSILIILSFFLSFFK